MIYIFLNSFLNNEFNDTSYFQENVEHFVE